MKKIQLATLLLLFTTSSLTFSQNVGIGTENPDASAVLDLSPPNKDKGLLLPRMDSIARNSMVNPGQNLLIFNTDSQCYEGYSTQKTKWFPVGCLKETITPFISCGDILPDGRDGNKYKTVQIGNQCWMAENLRYLPEVFGSGLANTSTSSPRYYVNNYNGTDVTDAKKYVLGGDSIYNIYGVLYNWPAVMQGEVSSNGNPSGIQGSCPEGWHVPSDLEWCEMENFIEPGLDPGCDAPPSYRGITAATKLKAQIGWNGTDDYGFAALPGGFRFAGGTWRNPGGTYGRWWTATEENSTAASCRYITSSNDGVYRIGVEKSTGFSLRCVLD